MSHSASSALRPGPDQARTGRAAALELTIRHPACQAAIGAITALAAAAVGSVHRADPPVAVLLVVAVVCFGALSGIDLAEQRLPNRITVPLAGATMVAVLVGGTIRSGPGAAVGAIGVGLGFALIFLVMQFGMGDVKLALSVGTIAGWFGGGAVLTTAVVGATSGAIVALVLMVIHRRRDLSFSFGPFLAIGCVAGMLVSGA